MIHLEKFLNILRIATILDNILRAVKNSEGISFAFKIVMESK